jgi:hypothetical protein
MVTVSLVFICLLSVCRSGAALVMGRNARLRARCGARDDEPGNAAAITKRLRSVPVEKGYGLGGKVDRNSSSLAESLSAGDPDQAPSPPCLRRHLLRDVANGGFALACVCKRNPVIGPPNIYFSWRWKPPGERLLEVTEQTLRNVDEVVEMLTGTVTMDFAGPNERWTEPAQPGIYAQLIPHLPEENAPIDRRQVVAVGRAAGH